MRLEAVRKHYRGGSEVLAGVDLTVAPGAPVVVLGGNGTGKSTLLRIAAGCSAPSAGRVVGRPRPVGYLPADLPAPERMPARAFLAHLAAIRRSAAPDTAALLGRLGFTGGLDVPMARLSTGNAQKIGLVQALCGAPGLVVLDEPWSGLDSAAADVLDELVASSSAGVLLADHTGRAASLPGVRAFRLRDGRLAVEPPAAPRTVVELHCPADPALTVIGLPAVTRWCSDGPVLTVQVPVPRGDDLLAAALAAGCSVLGVRRS